VSGYDVLRDSLEVRRRVGYLPETVPLYREMSVRDYLDFVASIRGVAKREQAVERVVEACDIGDVADKLIGKLSKGYRQRVGLAQALVHDRSDGARRTDHRPAPPRSQRARTHQGLGSTHLHSEQPHPTRVSPYASGCSS
jgi:hypothetical protein